MSAKRVTIGFQEPSAAIPIPGRHNVEGSEEQTPKSQGSPPSATATSHASEESAEVMSTAKSGHPPTKSLPIPNAGPSLDGEKEHPKGAPAGGVPRPQGALTAAVAAAQAAQERRGADTGSYDSDRPNTSDGHKRVSALSGKQMSTSWESNHFMEQVLPFQQDSASYQRPFDGQSAVQYAPEPLKKEEGGRTTHAHSLDASTSLAGQPPHRGGSPRRRGSKDDAPLFGGTDNASFPNQPPPAHLQTHFPPSYYPQTASRQPSTGEYYQNMPQTAIPTHYHSQHYHGHTQSPSSHFYQPSHGHHGHYHASGRQSYSNQRRASIASTSLSATDLFQKSPKGRQFPSIHSHAHQHVPATSPPSALQPTGNGMDGLGISYQPSFSGNVTAAASVSGNVKAPSQGGEAPSSSVAATEQTKMTKAERRALQEQQKAAKMAAKASNNQKSMSGHSANRRGSGGNEKSKKQLAGGLAGANASGASLNASAGSTAANTAGGSASAASATASGVAANSSSNNSREAKGQRGHSAGTTSTAGGGPATKIHAAKLSGRTLSSQNQKGIQFFSHLPVAEEALRYTSGLRARLKSKDAVIHPAILSLALQYSRMHILGSNARCLAMLQAFREVISDYTIPENQTLSRHLESYLKPQIDYLTKARALSVGMGSAIRHLKIRISKSEPNLPEDDAKKQIDQVIRKYIRERILISGSQIATYAASKIKNGDVILTYSRSTTVERVLLHAHERGIQFRVIVVDARPLCEGRTMMERLASQGVHVTYGWINAIGVLIKDATKVFLGASAVLNNGSLLSRAGTAVIALSASDARIPLMVCCETYKFTERLVLDSIVMNELGDPIRSLYATNRFQIPIPTRPASQPPTNVVAASSQLSGKGAKQAAQYNTAGRNDNAGEQAPCATDLYGQPILGAKGAPLCKTASLHLLYDVTPSTFITCIVTELGLIPSTSIPVVLRRSKDDMQ